MVRRVVLDTNIVLRAASPSDPQHALVAGALDLLEERGDELLVVPQVARELMHSLMRPKTSNGFGVSLERAREIVLALEGGRTAIVNDTPAVYREWLDLVTAIEVRGRQVHDANIAAAMRASGIAHLLTLNAPDFARYPGLVLLTPTGVLAEAT